jgi:4-amino-4-deoxy-L-arabinose transferase-like glycosyltransferase
VIVGVALRVFHLTYLSLWNDELFSRFYYQTGLAYMWTEGLQSESSPPLYYMALGAWIQVFGSGEAALRALSVAASSIAILLVYMLGKEILERTQALLAAGLFALSATQIYFAQEARPYALLLMPVAVTLLACARYLRAAGAWNLACYVGCAVLCIYTHATMVFFVAGCGIAVLSYVGASGRRRERGTPKGWIVANACVALLALPELKGMLRHVANNQLAWIPLPGFRDIGAVLSNTVVGTLTPGAFPGGELAVVLCCLLALVLWRRPPDQRASVIILGIPLIYVACVLVVTLTFQPMMLSRIFAWIGIPLCLLPAHSLSVRWRLQPVAAVVIVVVSAVGLFYQLDANPDAKEPWRNVIRDIGPDLTRADLVVLGPETDPADLIYYTPPLRRVQIWTEAAPPDAQLGVMPRLFRVPRITRSEIIAWINGDTRVVIVLRTADVGFLPSLLQDVRAPTQRIDRRCRRGDGEITKYPCGLTVLSWGDGMKRE